MFKSLLVLPLVLSAWSASACDPGHAGSKLFAKRIQPGSTEALAYPTRELQWGDVNFLATTDSHGWLVGHQKASYPEPNYSGDFGDFASFVYWMKKMAVEKDVDLLLVDSGDLHDGNPTSDAGVDVKGEVDGVRSDKIFAQLPYDALAIGNHELYKAAVASDVYKNFAPKWNGRYLTSNVNITIQQDGNNVSVPIGERFAKFQTRKGRNVTALDSSVTVQPPAAMVNETWFLEAIKEAPDFFLVLGHMPIRGANADFDKAVGKIRAIHPHVPVFVFGGHSHIRDCTTYDGRSMLLESGRYMETVGWMSSTLPAANTTGNLTMSRRYIDPNRNSYAWHTRRNDVFDTTQGINITQQLQNVVSFYNVSTNLGTAPQDYYLQRSTYGSNDSMLTFLSKEVLPSVIVDDTRTNPKLVIINSGSQRFDLYQGPFAQGDNYIVSPFNDNFTYIEVPNKVATQVLGLLNGVTTATKRSWKDDHEEGAFERAQRRAWENYARFGASHEDVGKRDLELKARGSNRSLTLGYVTEDACPGLGDDILHNPVPFTSDIPTYISTTLPSGLKDDDKVDLVFLDFFAPTVVEYVNQLNATLNVTTADVKTYGPSPNTVAGLRTDEMWGAYASKYWST